MARLLRPLEIQRAKWKREASGHYDFGPARADGGSRIGPSSSALTNAHARNRPLSRRQCAIDCIEKNLE
jgi:hypothetical protein